MRWLDRFLTPRASGAATHAYHQAMGESGDLIKRMREHSISNDPARAVMADIWAQNRNIPFLTAVYETVREMKAATTDHQLPPTSPK